MTVYKPNIPQPTDRPTISQGDILHNFQNLNTIFAVNHYEYDWGVAVDRGKARYITYVNQGIVDPAVAGTDWASFVKFTTHPCPAPGVQSAPFIRNSTNVYNSPIIIECADTANLSGNVDVYDFTGQPSMIGFILAYDSNTMSQNVFGLFAWRGAPTNILNLTGNSLHSGTVFGITHNLAILQIQVSVATNVRTRIWATLL